MESSSTAELRGKTALITGGTTGIGRATAELLHRAGARVAVTGNNPETLAAARRELPEDVLVVAADARSLSMPRAWRASSSSNSVDWTSCF